MEKSSHPILGTFTSLKALENKGFFDIFKPFSTHSLGRRPMDNYCVNKEVIYENSSEENITSR